MSDIANPQAGARAQTLNEALLALLSVGDERGFTFLPAGPGEERYLGFTALVKEAQRYGRLLRGLGLKKGDRVALIIPDKAALGAWANEQGITSDEGLLKDPRTLKLFQAEIDRISVDFKGFEKPRDFILDSEEFTTENGLLTPTLKLKRRNVMSKYESRLKALYA